MHYNYLINPLGVQNLKSETLHIIEVDWLVKSVKLVTGLAGKMGWCSGKLGSRTDV